MFSLANGKEDTTSMVPGRIPSGETERQESLNRECLTAKCIVNDNLTKEMLKIKHFSPDFHFGFSYTSSSMSCFFFRVTIPIRMKNLA